MSEKSVQQNEEVFRETERIDSGQRGRNAE